MEQGSDRLMSEEEGARPAKLGETLRVLESYAPLYIGDQASLENRTRLRANWWEALVFWFGHAFYRGRSDAVSEKFETAAKKALEDVLGEDKTAGLEALRPEDLAMGGSLDAGLSEAGVPHWGIGR